MSRLFNKAPHFYFHDQSRWVSGDLLMWFGEDATEDFWLHYWDQQISTTNYYENARNLDLSHSPVGRIFLNELLKEGLHLEAGCGAGYWVAALNNAGYNIEGIEYSKQLVDLVHEAQLGINVNYGDALAISSPDNYFDTYISLGVMEHDINGPQAFLREAYRVLKPGGTIIISVPYFGFIRKMKSKFNLYSKSKPDLPFFQYGFTKEHMTKLLHKSGFRVKSTYQIGDVHRLLSEEIRIYHWLSYQRGGYYLRKLITKLYSPFDGHMIFFVAHKINEID